ncbi:MAG: hypothetical protein OXE58_09160 [Acidobacteria bacterium]|nr:hypothetical protein [Acidobacteriota bacterium]
MQATTAILTIASLAGALVLLGRLRVCAVDNFRQDMFALRDELFDLASSGALSFDHPAYGMLRSTMNGFVRWADRLQLLQLVVLFVFWSHRNLVSERRFEIQWKEALATLPESEQDALGAYRERMHLLLIRYLIFSSPVLVATLVVPAITLLFGMTILKLVMALGEGLLEGVDAQALEFGLDKNGASAFPAPSPSVA